MKLNDFVSEGNGSNVSENSASPLSGKKTCSPGYDISKIHSDCGIEIFDAESQNTGAGGSGCGCSAVTLSAYFLKQIEDGTLKRILFVPTGALLSTVSFNEGMTVPGIAHAVVIEHADA